MTLLADERTKSWTFINMLSTHSKKYPVQYVNHLQTQILLNHFLQNGRKKIFTTVGRVFSLFQL